MMSTGPETEDARRFFAVAAPGLEDVTADELRALGARVLGVPRGGVAFAGPLLLGFRANLWLRTAVAVRLRLAKFHAPSERLLAKRTAEIDWGLYLPPGEEVELAVSTVRSHVGHSGRVEELIRQSLRVPAPPSPGNPAGSPERRQSIHVRIVQNTCTLSLDMSGELLHRRGYRQETSRGPLRETLAAALILACGWDPVTPFVDPMCGSGTLPIEAALMSMNRAPGLERSFACERWPSADSRAWEALRAEARAQIRTSPGAVIVGSDRNAGAVNVTRRNAERAHVASYLTLERREVAQVESPRDGPGLFLTNPPFGRRVAEVQALEVLYREIGRVLVARFAGWQAAVVSADRRLEGRIALAHLGEREFMHGGLSCRLVHLDTRAHDPAARGK